MAPSLRAALVVLLALVLAAGSALAQPTFGRPKPGKKKKAETPAQVDWEEDVHDARPDLPEESSLGDMDSPEARFIPSPEEWLENDPPRAEPAADLKPGQAYAWRSSDGLRFSYTVPADYRAGRGYDLVVICHPAGQDFRWGLVNHLSPAAAAERGSPRLAFRPGNIVVSVDGIAASAARPGVRSFPCDDAAVIRFRDFLLELTRILPGRRIYLYGCGGGNQETGGGGGQFVMRFAQVFPALADGVVAYGAGRQPGQVGRTSVPIVIVHGVKNPVVPFAEALAAHRDNVEAGNTLVRLRALRSFNDYPNPVRVSECIEWLGAVRTEDPAEALACIERMLTPKGGDEYDYVCPVWYAGAREVAGRILGEPGPLTGVAPFEGKNEPSAAVRQRTREIVSLLEAEAEKHVAALREVLPEDRKAGSLVLDAGPWLGHLIAARDDFRGIGPMDNYARAIEYDQAAEAHARAAEEFMADWYTRPDEENFEMAAAVLPHCYLYEGLPVELPARMKFWKRQHQSGELEVSAEALEGLENVMNWDEGYRRGLDSYRQVWRAWRFEPSEPGGGGGK